MAASSHVNSAAWAPRRMDARALYDGRHALARRARGLCAPVRERAHLSGPAPGKLVPSLRDRHQRPRGGPRGDPRQVYYVRYPIQGNPGEFITVATTRPETILEITAVAVHPQDRRYKKTGGETALPRRDRPIPIIADCGSGPQFGTGAVKVTPGHDRPTMKSASATTLPIVNIMNRERDHQCRGRALRRA